VLFDGLYAVVVGDNRELTYWDPMPHLASGFASLPQDGLWAHSRGNLPRQMGRAELAQRPRSVLRRHDRQLPGRAAPRARHVLYGADHDYELEFLYRQPRNNQELHNVIIAMQEDPCSGWACDGDANWTPALVRQWWHERGRLRDWITTKYRRWYVSDRAAEREAATGLADYLAYLDGDLPNHLRAYIYFLDTGVSPNSDDRLPPL
jgi:hypothetical protein